MTYRTPLERVLIEEGRKQAWLARQAQIDPADLSRIVRGMHANETKRQAIADALGRPVDELWPGEQKQAA